MLITNFYLSLMVFEIENMRSLANERYKYRLPPFEVGLISPYRSECISSSFASMSFLMENYLDVVCQEHIPHIFLLQRL